MKASTKPKLGGKVQLFTVLQGFEQQDNFYSQQEKNSKRLLNCL